MRRRDSEKGKVDTAAFTYAHPIERKIRIKERAMNTPVWVPTLSHKGGATYKLIAESIAEHIHSGVLKPGQQLPTHRALAELLDVSVGTVTRAYGEAERRLLIKSTVGSGTFVLGAHHTGDGLHFAQPSIDHIDMSLSVALPIDETLVSQAQQKLSSATLSALCRYQPETQQPSLALAHSKWLSAIGLPSLPCEQICTTVGGQHALYVALSSVCESGDTILTDQLTYPGLLAVAKRRQIKVVGIESDQHGLCPRAFALALSRHRPKAVYLSSRISTPQSQSMSPRRVLDIATLATRHDIWIIEDDVQGCLHPTSNALFVAQCPERTLFISSLSKALLGGLRVGLLYVPEPLLRSVKNIIAAQILIPPQLTAELYSNLILDNDIKALLAQQKKRIAQRHRTALQILGDYVAYRRPPSLNLWLTLPKHWQLEHFVKAAKARGISLKSAEAFATSRAAIPNAVRISIGGTLSDEELQTGLRSLRRLLLSAAL